MTRMLAKIHTIPTHQLSFPISPTLLCISVIGSPRRVENSIPERHVPNSAMMRLNQALFEPPSSSAEGSDPWRPHDAIMNVIGIGVMMYTRNVIIGHQQFENAHIMMSIISETPKPMPTHVTAARGEGEGADDAVSGAARAREARGG